VFGFFVDAAVVKTWHGKGANLRGLAPFSRCLLRDGEPQSREHGRRISRCCASTALRAIGAVIVGAHTP